MCIAQIVEKHIHVLYKSLFDLQAAPQFCLQAQSVMCSVARPFPLQDTMVTAVAAHARLCATLRCMSAPRMVPTLAAHASVMVDSPRSWEVESATAFIEASR